MLVSHIVTFSVSYVAFRPPSADGSRDVIGHSPDLISFAPQSSIEDRGRILTEIARLRYPENEGWVDHSYSLRETGIRNSCEYSYVSSSTREERFRELIVLHGPLDAWPFIQAWDKAAWLVKNGSPIIYDTWPGRCENPQFSQPLTPTQDDGLIHLYRHFCIVRRLGLTDALDAQQMVAYQSALKAIEYWAEEGRKQIRRSWPAVNESEGYALLQSDEVLRIVFAAYCRNSKIAFSHGDGR